MKRILMIGDIGWSRFYHLGDEAMTEFALEALQERADVDVTLISGEPEYAAQMYGVNAISRIGFKRDREPNIRRMQAILDYVESNGANGSMPVNHPARPMIEAVRNCDAVLIAGGGNLNSMFAQHIFERATLAKIARHFGKPYALTSQTLGPLIYDEDREIVHELLAEAEFVGTRESYTTQLAEKLGGGKATIRRQVDDAFSLTARDEDRDAVADLAAEPFILASFAEKASSPMLTDKEYRRRLAEMVGRIADETGLRILLVPHGGAFPPADPTRDQLNNDRIASSAASPSVQPVRMLTARETVALTERAEVVIGTRYHAGIFAGAAAVPFIQLAPNLYSSIRMRGAAENVGMRDFVLPLDSVDDIVASVVGAVRNRDLLQSTMQAQSDARREEHRKWWDFVVAHTLETETEHSSERSGAEPPGFFHAEEISNDFVANIDVTHERLNAVEDYGLLLAVKDRRVAVARAEAVEAQSQLERAEARLERAKQRREQREKLPLMKVARKVQKVERALRRTARTT